MQSRGLSCWKTDVLKSDSSNISLKSLRGTTEVKCYRLSHCLGLLFSGTHRRVRTPLWLSLIDVSGSGSWQWEVHFNGRRPGFWCCFNKSFANEKVKVTNRSYLLGLKTFLSIFYRTYSIFSSSGCKIMKWMGKITTFPIILTGEIWDSKALPTKLGDICLRLSISDIENKAPVMFLLVFHQHNYACLCFSYYLYLFLTLLLMLGNKVAHCLPPPIGLESICAM